MIAGISPRRQNHGTGVGVGLPEGTGVGTGETDPAGVGLAVGAGVAVGVCEGIGDAVGTVLPVGVGATADGRSQTARPGFIWLPLSNEAIEGVERAGIEEPPVRYAVVPVGETYTTFEFLSFALAANCAADLRVAAQLVKNFSMRKTIVLRASSVANAVPQVARSLLAPARSR